jgi:chemotaxis protein methyltransferase CheR
MALLEAVPEATELDWRVLATDISETILPRARAGTYPASAVAALPPTARDRWFGPAADGPLGSLRVVPALALLVAFRRLNLAGDWPMRRAFDAILCRNVSISFDAATQARLSMRLADRLAPRDQLMIGHSERVSGPAERLLHLVGTRRYASAA